MGPRVKPAGDRFGLSGSGERRGLRTTRRPIEQLDRVHDRDAGAGRDLGYAADIAGGDDLRCHTLDVLHLAVAQLVASSGCSML